MRNNGGALASVNMEKSKLLDILKTNRTKHITEFDKAIVCWRQALLDTFKQNNKAMQTNIRLASKALNEGTNMAPSQVVQAKSVPVMPVSYEAYYDKAIRMIELSADDVLTIEAAVFNQLVLDEWEWSNSFIAVTSSYLAK